MKGLFDLYINSSLHVALAVVSLALVSSLHYNIKPDSALLLFIFFGAITGYNFVKYAGIAGLHHRSLTKGLKVVQVISFFCFLFLVVTLFFVPKEVLIWGGVSAAVILLYALPVFSRSRSLRRIPGLKIFVIALVWAVVTAILPAISQEVSRDLVILETLQKFFFVLALILPFEIRDLKYDLEELRTLPQLIGISGTRMVGLLILLLVLITGFLKENSSVVSAISLIIVTAVLGVAVLVAREGQSAYYSSFWVESIPLLWLFLLLLLPRLL